MYEPPTPSGEDPQRERIRNGSTPISITQWMNGNCRPKAGNLQVLARTRNLKVPQNYKGGNLEALLTARHLQPHSRTREHGAIVSAGNHHLLPRKRIDFFADSFCFSVHSAANLCQLHINRDDLYISMIRNRLTSLPGHPVV